MIVTPFEHDIADQPEALRRIANTPLSASLVDVAARDYERIVVTGMGSSHFAGLPTWRRLVAAGRPAWWIDSGQLLDSPELITARTLVIATSQSGASGEIAALADGTRPAALIAVTNDEASALAACAAATVALHSGHEATVSTKSYLNTLAAHDLISSALLGTPVADLLDTAKAVERINAPDSFSSIADRYVVAANPRLAYIGFGDHAATALYGGLITKEGAKIPAEGYIGGQFRHGPLELAGPGLVAVLCGDADPDANMSIERLGHDLVAAGSTVISLGALDLSGAAVILSPNSSGTVTELAFGAVIAQQLTVAIARARGITPGAFAYGSKITTAL